MLFEASKDLGGFNRHGRQPLDMCRTRALPHPALHQIELLRAALDQRFDRAVGAIAHPAAHFEQLRMAQRGVAKTYALDDAGDAYMTGFDNVLGDSGRGCR